MVHQPILAPSLLAGNHAQLKLSLAEVESISAVSWIHLDIMDGHFVPNLTFGPQTVADLRPHSQLFFDTHLMLDNPHRYIEAFASAGADLISIHVEPDYDVADTLRAIANLGKQNGVVINPGTPADAVLPFLEDVDLVLIMTVQPGFGGQKFQREMVAKMEQIHQWRQERGLSFRLEVDGGIDLNTFSLCKKAGVDTFVAGSAFFSAQSREEFAKTLQS